MELVAIAVLLFVAALVTVGAIRVGMLLAPRIDRWGTPRDDPTDEPGNEGGKPE